MSPYKFKYRCVGGILGILSVIHTMSREIIREFAARVIRESEEERERAWEMVPKGALSIPEFIAVFLANHGPATKEEIRAAVIAWRGSVGQMSDLFAYRPMGGKLRFRGYSENDSRVNYEGGEQVWWWAPQNRAHAQFQLTPHGFEVAKKALTSIEGKKEKFQFKKPTIANIESHISAGDKIFIEGYEYHCNRIQLSPNKNIPTSCPYGFEIYPGAYEEWLARGGARHEQTFRRPDQVASKVPNGVYVVVSIDDHGRAVIKPDGDNEAYLVYNLRYLYRSAYNRDSAEVAKRLLVQTDEMQEKNSADINPQHLKLLTKIVRLLETKKTLRALLSEDLYSAPTTEQITIPPGTQRLWADDVERRFPAAWRAWLGSWADAVSERKSAGDESAKLAYYAVEPDFFASDEGHLYASVVREEDALLPATSDWVASHAEPEHRSHERPHITLAWDDRRAVWLSDEVISHSFHSAGTVAISQPTIDPDEFDSREKPDLPPHSEDVPAGSEAAIEVSMRDFESQFPDAFQSLEQHLSGVWDDESDSLLDSEFYTWRGWAVVWSARLDDGAGLVLWDEKTMAFTDVDATSDDEDAKLWRADNPDWVASHVT